MPKYKVRGTIEYNFQCIVEAENEDKAEEEAKDYADDGDIELGELVEDAQIIKIVKVT